MKSKIFALIITLILTMPLAACGGDGGVSVGDSSGEKPSATEQAAAVPDSPEKTDVTGGSASSSGKINYRSDEDVSAFFSYVYNQCGMFEKVFNSELRDYDNEHMGSGVILGGEVQNANAIVGYSALNLGSYGELSVDKTQNGDEIVWSVDGNNKSFNPEIGEYHLTLTVTLNTRTNTATAEKRESNDNGHDTRETIETVVLDDGTVLTAYTAYSKSVFNGRPTERGVSQLFSVNGDTGEFEGVFGVMKTLSPDYSPPGINGDKFDFGAFDNLVDHRVEMKISGGNLTVNEQ